MTDLDLESLSSAPSGPTAPARGGSPVPLLVGLLVVGLFGAIATLAAATALAGLGLWWGLGLGLLPGVMLPIALALRIMLIARKRSMPPVAGLVAGVGIALTVQVGLIIGVFEFVGRTSGDVAAVTAAAVEQSLGDIPFLARVLGKLSTRGDRTIPDPGKPWASGDGPVAAASDGGTLDEDAGAAETADGGAAAGEPAAEPLDAGNLPAEQPFDAGPGGPLSVDRPVLHAASLVKTSKSADGVVVTTVGAEGAVSHRFLDLDAFTKEGNPRHVHVGPTGEVAVLMGTAAVLRSSGDRLVAIPALARGKRFEATNSHGDDIEVELRSIDNLRLLKGGTLLISATLLVDDGEKPALQAAVVGWMPKDPDQPFVVRRESDAVPGAEGAQARRFELKQSSPFGAFALVEHFTVKNIDVPTATTGSVWKMNPQRLLVGHADAPEALAEVARSGVSATGAGDKTLQAFFDVAFAGDDRIVVDANYAQRSRDGALFVAGMDGSISKLGTRGAQWSKGAPRVRWLTVEPDGKLAFIDRSGSLVRGSLDEPGTLKAVLRQSKVKGSDDKTVRVDKPLRPRIGRGGAYVLVEVSTKEGSALVLDGPEGQRVLLRQDDAIPVAGADPVTLTKLKLQASDDHPLWPRR